MAKLMNLDKTLLKRTIDQTKPQDLLVLQMNKLEKGSVNTNLKIIEKFMNSKDDYIIMVMRR
jgi:Trp operon repressor